MKKSGLEWKVGLFAFIGLGLLGALLIQFSRGTTFFRPTYEIRLRSSDVGELKIHSSVLLSGVQVGTVTHIKLAPDGKTVTITLRIFKQYEIHKDAKFSIKASSFLGDKFVSIQPTKNEAPAFNQNVIEEAQADRPIDLLEVASEVRGSLARFDEAATNVSAAIADVHRLVLNERTLTNLSTMIVDLRAAADRASALVDNLGALLSTNGPSISLAVSNLGAFSIQLSQFGTNLSTLLASNSADITEAVTNLKSSTQSLKTIVDEVQAGKGTVGVLLKNEEMAANLSQIANNLSLTTSNLNRLGLWGILWKKKAPATNAPPRESRSAPKKSR